MRLHPHLRTPFASLLTLGLLALAFAVPTPSPAQGCTLCRDNTASTPPATQRAYRHAIELMTTAASAFFVGTLLIARKLR